jgi:hypothetical protein
MFKNFQRKLTLRKGFVISVISLIVIDAIFLTIYYQLYFNSHLYNKYADLNNKLSDEVKEIIKRIDNWEDADKYLDEYCEDNNVSITIKDTNDEYIYKNI